MGYIDAELDLAPIDKVDVRNELRRFTVFPATEADFQNFASYCNRRLPHYYITVFQAGPTRPDPARPGPAARKTPKKLSI